VGNRDMRGDSSLCMVLQHLLPVKSYVGNLSPHGEPATWHSVLMSMLHQGRIFTGL
jgi:hypothetical protein